MEAALEIEFEGGSHSTTFRCLRQDPPWKVVRGFTLETGETLVHLNNVSGGIFGGDSLNLSAQLGREAKAQITTTGATRVYRPRPEAADACLASTFHIGRNALLEYLPDALIPFRQARVSQRTAYSLEEGATLFCWDTIAPGRTAAGELFAYERMKLVSEIRVAQRPILNDRLLLEPRRWPPGAVGRFGSYKYLVTFIAMRAGSTAAEVRALEECLEAVVADRSMTSEYQGSCWGVTTLPAHGVFVRGMVESSLGIPGMLYALWSAAKLQLCGRAAIAPRKTY